MTLPSIDAEIRLRYAHGLDRTSTARHTHHTDWMRSLPARCQRQVWKRLPVNRLSGVRGYARIHEPRPSDLLMVQPRPIPDSIRRPPYAVNCAYEPADLSQPGAALEDIGEHLGAMRRAACLTRRALELALSLVKPGVTTDHIDAQVHEWCMQNDAYPSPLGYPCSPEVGEHVAKNPDGARLAGMPVGLFPRSVCTSVNNVLCHGIPDLQPLQEGDVINVDVSLYTRDGVHGDCSRTVGVGSVEPHALCLMQTAWDCLQAGISVCAPGVPIGAIGERIETLANKAGFSVPENFCGHGIGREFHMYPDVVHTINDYDLGVMEVGQVFTIEPILAAGTSDFEIGEDTWSALTADGKWSAQFEDTILITPSGCEILTRLPGSVWDQRPTA